MTSRSRFSSRFLLALLAVTTAMVSLSQCDEATAPVPAGRLSVQSGANQYWRIGNELPEPLVVLALTEDKSVPADAVVRFRIVQGGGSLSASKAAVNKQGRASVRLTLGPAPGVNIVEASLEDDPSKKQTFRAIGSYYFCPEMSDTLQVSYGPRGQLFHVTPKSELYAPGRGVVQLSPAPPVAASFAEIPGVQGFIEPVIRDAAFSPRGDFYVSRLLFFEELIKVGIDGTVTRLAGLERISEIAENPIGLIVGCDIKGPFIVQCPDTLLRFPEATYADGVNDDALAVDRRRNAINALGEDIYYIHKPDATLRRLPMDSLTVTGPVEIVAQLTTDEAASCRGMDTDDQGNIFLVVSSQDTKKLLRFSPAGARTQLFDFFTVGAGDEAGMLSDIAVDNTIVYTIDTYNDNLIAYVTNTQEFLPLFADSLQQSFISDRAPNGTKSGGERTGLAVLK